VRNSATVYATFSEINNHVHVTIRLRSLRDLNYCAPYVLLQKFLVDLTRTMELSYSVRLNIDGIRRFSHVFPAYGAIFRPYHDNDNLIVCAFFTR